MHGIPEALNTVEFLPGQICVSSSLAVRHPISACIKTSAVLGLNGNIYTTPNIKAIKMVMNLAVPLENIERKEEHTPSTPNMPGEVPKYRGQSSYGLAHTHACPTTTWDRQAWWGGKKIGQKQQTDRNYRALPASNGRMCETIPDPPSRTGPDPG
ncbi:hypothetical protein Bbelb_293330 [Branchiostoma belcheri]|nr:hypothetical protein Bbelb_293330 [Branchiostoma belcheri]